MTAANLRGPPAFQNCNGNDFRKWKKIFNGEEEDYDDVIAAVIAMDFINGPGKGSSKKRVGRYCLREATQNVTVSVGPVRSA